jgi:hemoglobin
MELQLSGKRSDSPFGTGDASFQAAGGVEGITQLVDDFYQFMDDLPEAKTIREMHKTDLAIVKDKLVCFLASWLGGPRLYNEKYGSISIPGVHMPFAIGEAERDAWLLCMQNAVDLQPYDSDFAAYFMAQIRMPAERIYLTNRRNAAMGGQ